MHIYIYIYKDYIISEYKSIIRRMLLNDEIREVSKELPVYDIYFLVRQAPITNFNVHWFPSP
jgi:hypothetical protein